MSIMQYTTIACNQCDRLISTATGKLREAESRARREGWKKSKDRRHYCPRCVENRL